MSDLRDIIAEQVAGVISSAQRAYNEHEECADAIVAALTNCGLVTIPRAQYEALMAAANILPSMLFDHGDDDTRREAYAAIAALRAAGIQIEEE